MRRDQKLSPDNELDLKYILTFTAVFVVVSSILLVAGYAILSLTGILGQGQAEGTGTPTPVPSPTARPTAVAIGVPTTPPVPTPVITPAPTPTPTPTPVPSPYKLSVILDQTEAPSMVYNVIIGAVAGYQPVDTTRVRLSVSYGTTEYCNYNFEEAVYWLDGNWSNSNGDKRLDPTGEKIKFRISAYALKIPLDIETRLIMTLDGVQILNLPMPSFQNYADLSGGSPDPGSGGIVQNPDNIVRWY